MPMQRRRWLQILTVAVAAPTALAQQAAQAVTLPPVTRPVAVVPPAAARPALASVPAGAALVQFTFWNGGDAPATVRIGTRRQTVMRMAVPARTGVFWRSPVPLRVDAGQPWRVQATRPDVVATVTYTHNGQMRVHHGQ